MVTLNNVSIEDLRQPIDNLDTGRADLNGRLERF